MSDLSIVKCDAKSEETDVEYYNKAADYWGSVDPTLDGMLGGFAKISHTDIDGSNKLVKVLLREVGGPGRGRALDCGAGIGRITKHLLTKFFDTVDLVEQDEHFLEKGREYLKDNPRVGTLYCSGLQNFKFTDNTYDLIWCQWVLGHLTDDHLVTFLIRASESLKENGVIVVKENVTSDGNVETDEQDSSVTRPSSLLKEIFGWANLTIYKEFKQNKFPKDIFDVFMYALKPVNQQ